MNITKEENLVNNCFYWGLYFEEGWDIFQWRKGKFWMCGSDMPIYFKDLVSITPVCILRH